MYPDTISSPFYEAVYSLFGLLVFLVLTGAIFYWVIKAFIRGDKKLKQEMLKPFFYIITGSALTVIIRNALVGTMGLMSSILPFLSFFFLGFFFYSLTIDHLNNIGNSNKELNHLKGLIATFFVCLIVLVLTIR